jgi:hypothetical protein
MATSISISVKPRLGRLARISCAPSR